MEKLFKEVVFNDPRKAYQDYLFAEEKVKNSTAIYKGQPVDFLYYSLFFNDKEYKKIKLLVEKFAELMDRVIDEYMNNDKFRKSLGFSPLLEELIRIDPGYKMYFPVARFDIFYKNSDDSIFCELNTDGSSAMNEVRVIQQVLLESMVMKKLKECYELQGFELFYSWIDEMISLYREFCNNNSGEFNETPNIAIMDFKGEGTIFEFREFQQRMIKRGYQTVICDPRELKFKNGRLYYDDLIIDLIYRRATTGRLVEEANEIQDFINAYREQAVCVVGGLASQVIHNKKIFALLHNTEQIDFLNPEEKKYIKKHVPYTVIFDNKNDKLRDKIINQKNKWILKPFDKKAGSGVFAGRDFTKGDWQDIIHNIANDNYLVQEYIDVPEKEMFSAGKKEETNKLFLEKYGYLIGLFLYNKKVKGLYTRAGRKSVIGAAAESYTIPNYLYRRYKE